ncbi:hypothetical protein [uncultured Ornithinimicrobium sp.]|uniref:hypothetical protein n=1 Tax=uncultured Ornithinimicrobium sp. TaxID=259307 RepID=UPI0025955BEE|nr:hypothetical protein [uncultured Ornithinimicrobium sp.]
MTEAGETVAVYEAEDGILVFGTEAALMNLDADPDVVSKPISKRHVARIAGHAGTMGGRLAAESGRWLKLTPESAQHVRAAGGRAKVASGVLRDKGQITKHLKFDNLSKGGALTPAAPAVFGAMATQYAIEAALDDITAYLEEIDRKIDQLLKQRKTETLGQIGGVSLAIDEAVSIYASTGTVSSTTWSKVQGTSLALQTMQAESVEQLHVLSEDVKAAAGDADKAAKVLTQVSDDVQFWLGVLARTIALQDRQYVLELARVADEDEQQLDAHREGITVARSDRVCRIVAGLEAIVDSVAASSTLSNAAKVANPISAPKVARQANSIADSVSAFAQHAGLELGGSGSVDLTPWARAARGLLDEASTVVTTAGTGVAGRARLFGRAVEERRDERVLRRAKRIEEKRSGDA